MATGVNNDDSERKKRIAIIVVSSFLLVGMLIGVTLSVTLVPKNSSEPTDDKKANEVAASMKAVKTICRNTEFKKECIHSLHQEAGTSTDPLVLIRSAFKAAIKKIKKGAEKSVTIHKLEKDPRTKMAIDQCKELAEMSISELQRSFKKIYELDIQQVDTALLDLKTWLSAAYTYQDTCLDGFENTTGDAAAKMKSALKSGMHLTSNGITIVSQMHKALAEISFDGIVGRRLLADEDDDKDRVPIPGHGKIANDWRVDAKSRKLLQLQSSSNVSQQVGAVVPKDGSGRFTTINETLKPIPKSLPPQSSSDDVVANDNNENLTPINEGPKAIQEIGAPGKTFQLQPLPNGSKLVDVIVPKDNSGNLTTINEGLNPIPKIETPSKTFQPQPSSNVSEQTDVVIANDNNGNLTTINEGLKPIPKIGTPDKTFPPQPSPNGSKPIDVLVPKDNSGNLTTINEGLNPIPKIGTPDKTFPPQPLPNRSKPIDVLVPKDNNRSLTTIDEGLNPIPKLETPGKTFQPQPSSNVSKQADVVVAKNNSGNLTTINEGLKPIPKFGTPDKTFLPQPLPNGSKPVDVILPKDNSGNLTTIEGLNPIPKIGIPSETFQLQPSPNGSEQADFVVAKDNSENLTTINEGLKPIPKIGTPVKTFSPRPSPNGSKPVDVIVPNDNSENLTTINEGLNPIPKIETPDKTFPPKPSANESKPVDVIVPNDNSGNLTTINGGLNPIPKIGTQDKIFPPQTSPNGSKSVDVIVPKDNSENLTTINGGLHPISQIGTRDKIFSPQPSPNESKSVDVIVPKDNTWNLTAINGGLDKTFQPQSSPNGSKSVDVIVPKDNSGNFTTINEGPQVIPNIGSPGKTFQPQSSSNVSDHVDIVVAKNGSGNFTTINEALEAFPQNRPPSKTFVIYIKEGVYNEQVTISSIMNNLMFIGDGPLHTRITGNRNFKQNMTTYLTATVGVNADNFIAKNIGFENTAGPENYQAVALRVTSDKAIFYNCSMDGHQDTLYAHAKRQFYRDCTISGTIDFVFGNALAVFQNCTFLVRKPLNKQDCIVTAQGREKSDEPTALVLQGCRILADTSYQPIKSINKAYLGRPWKEYSRTIIMNSFVDDLIAPEGYTPWDGDFALKTLMYGEYSNHGVGADKSKRVAWPGILKTVTTKLAESYTPGNFLLGNDWIKDSGVPYDPSLSVSQQ